MSVEMKNLTIKGINFEVVDKQARDNLSAQSYIETGKDLSVFINSVGGIDQDGGDKDTESFVNSYKRSNYINVLKGGYVKYKNLYGANGYPVIAFYDNLKNLVKTINGTGTTSPKSGEVFIDNDGYVRICTYNGGTSNVFISYDDGSEEIVSNLPMSNIVETAETYFKMAYNDHNLVYASNVSPFHPTFKSGDKNGIQCSGFINSIIKGIRADNNIYVGKENSPSYWAIDGLGEFQSFNISQWLNNGGTNDNFHNTYDYMSANDLYLFCLAHGNVIDVNQNEPEKNNFLPGDLIFSDFDNESKRFGHVVMVLNSGKYYNGSKWINEIYLMEARNGSLDHTGTYSVAVRAVRKSVDTSMIKIGRINYPSSLSKIIKLHDADISSVSGALLIYGEDSRTYTPGFYTVVLNGYNGTNSNPYIKLSYPTADKNLFLIKSSNRAICTFYAESDFMWKVYALTADDKNYLYNNVELYRGYYF